MMTWESGEKGAGGVGKVEEQPSGVQISAVFPHRGLPGGSGVGNLPANAGDLGSISGSGRSPGDLRRQTSLVGYRPQSGGTERLALSLSHTTLPRARLGASRGLSFPPSEDGDYQTYLLSMNLGDKGTVVPTSHDWSLLVASRIPPGPTGPHQAGDLNLWQDLCVDPCAPHLTLKEAPPTAQSKEVPPSASHPLGSCLHLPREKVQTREQSVAQLLLALGCGCPVWLGPGRGRCQAWQGDRVARRAGAQGPTALWSQQAWVSKTT